MEMAFINAKAAKLGILEGGKEGRGRNPRQYSSVRDNIFKNW